MRIGEAGFDCSLFYSVQTESETHLTSIQRTSGALSQGKPRPEGGTDNCPPSTADVKNKEGYASTLNTSS
jgi:hypothetical protein